MKENSKALTWAELRVGLLVIVSVVALAFAILYIGGAGSPFATKYNLRAQMTDVNGLKPGAPVRVGGVTVGSVIGVDFAGEGSGGLVEVVMRLERRVSSRVTTDSQATLGSLGLLGEKAVDISVSLTGIPISDGGYIRAAAEDPFRGLLSDASDSTAHIKRILARMDAGEGLVGKALRDEELYARMVDVSVRLQEAMNKIESSDGPLGRLMNDQEMSDRFASSARAVETMLTRIESGEGALGVLSKDEALVAQLRELTANLQKASAAVQRGEGTLGKLVHDDALYSRMAEVSVHLESTLGRLERGEGTAGQLLRDTELYDNLNGTLADIRGLVTDVRRDPNKYLRVKVSLF